ncbi:MAG: FGGY family carbohydrate kinase, partial [Sphaerochaetaceae bacterium]|nr:FGGY family carbohydrate kinase [Sphaerochaetaceae bacterium]
MSLLGFDIGTTGVKGLLVGDSGSILAEASASYAVSSPKPSWYEQDPEDWWQASVSVIRQLLHAAPQETGEITGIGISGQYHGLVILDKDDAVIRPAILWNDQRTQAESDQIISKAGKQTLFAISASGGAPYFTACKL